MDALRLRGRSETEWDVIDGRSDQVVGRVIQENGAFFLIDIEADVELGAFYRLEQAVTAANTLLGGTDFTIRSPS